MSTATTVFESLTWPNPKLRHDLDGGRNSTNKNYHTPEKIIPWTEFNMDTIASIAGGNLLRTIQTTPSLLSAPPELDGTDCFGETYTAFIITKWTHEIVQKSLKAVKDQIPTCTWNPSIKARAKRGSSILVTASTSYASTPATESTIPAHAASLQAVLGCLNKGSSQKKKKLGLYPDAGATAACQTHGDSCAASWIERLPKDYKTSTKWRSWEALPRLLKDKNGNLIAKETAKDPAFPFRQAYTYCVEFNCRYGCILTTEEAFVFRIRPVDATDKTKTLTNTLRKHGLMEYASIPWSQNNGTAVVESGQKKKEQKTLTFNLAVWFLHVLAASESEPDWTYNVLKSEDLQLRECPFPRVPATPESEQEQERSLDRSRTRDRSISRKRAREDAGESFINSFTSDDLAFTGSLHLRRSRRSESAPSDTTYGNERTRRVPNGNLATSIEQGDSFASSTGDGETGHTELRRSKRVRADRFELKPST